jgi:hypothetical protein
VHIVTLQRQALATRRLHGVSAAHLQSYLDELCYRLKRRDQRLDLFSRILNRLRPVHANAHILRADRGLS